MSSQRTLALIGIDFALMLLGATFCNGLAKLGTFRVYSLPSTFGYFSAALSPNDRNVSVIAGATVTDTEIQIWDFRTAKLIAHRPLLPESALGRSSSSTSGVYAYSNSGSRILFCSGGYLKLLDAATLDPLKQIDLGASSWPALSPGQEAYSFIRAVAMDKRGERVAVLLQWGTGAGGELRVYNLTSGELIKKWNYEELRGKRDRTEDFGGADISSDGKVVSVSIIPFNLGEGSLSGTDRNVLVLDVDSGRTLSSINTGYPTGEVCFAATNPTSLLTVSADNYDRSRSHTDSIKVWNPLTGKLLRELQRPPEGVHFQVQVSSDGNTVLGYTGLEKFTGHWWLGEEENGIVAYDRFALWNFQTGKIIASSPEITPAQGHRRFLLSPSGDIVLMYPGTPGGTPLTLYEVQLDK